MRSSVAISRRRSSSCWPRSPDSGQLLDLGPVEPAVAVAVEDERLVAVDGAVPVAVEGVEQLAVVDRAVAVGVDDLEVVARVDDAVAVAVRGPVDVAGVDRAVAVEVRRRSRRRGGRSRRRRWCRTGSGTSLRSMTPSPLRSGGRRCPGRRRRRRRIAATASRSSMTPSSFDRGRRSRPRRRSRRRRCGRPDRRASSSSMTPSPLRVEHREAVVGRR